MGSVRGEGAGTATAVSPGRALPGAANCCSHSPGRLSSLMLFLGNLCSIATLSLPRTPPSPLLRERRPGKDGPPQTRVGIHQIRWGRSGPGAGGRPDPAAGEGLRAAGRAPAGGREAGGGRGRHKLLPFSLAGAEGERGTRAETGDRAKRPHNCAAGNLGAQLQGWNAGR